MDIKRSLGRVALAGLEPIVSKVNEAWQIYEDALISYSLHERSCGGRFAALYICEVNITDEREARVTARAFPDTHK